jgi:glutamyl-tRNA(Gln) amidotransferase subunit E
MKGLFGIELYKDFRYGTELSDYAKANGAGGIIHCDEDMKKYGFDKEIDEMVKSLKLKEGDGWIAIVGKDEVCGRAMDAVYMRAYLTEVPEETRRSDMEGKSHYMRPLPGAARMYPETDVKPVRITQKDIKEAAAKAVSFDDLKKEMQKLLNPELADKMLRSERMELFRELVKEGVEPTLAAVTLEDTLKTLRREGLDTSAITEESISEIFGLYLKERIVKAVIPELLREVVRSPKRRIADIMKERKLERTSGKDLEGLLKGMNATDMGAIMAKHRLNVDPEELKKSLAQGAKGQHTKK